MKVVNIGESYEIFPNSVKTYDKLPAQCYSVIFNKMSGFSLIKHEDLQITEKAYGTHEKKVQKVLNAFTREDQKKNLGIIMSGAKGQGKSLFAKMLANECVKRDIPVIIVDRYIPGIANYIEEIEQEVMVLFDEFDKTFGGVKQSEGAADAQVEMLTLFDGISSGKKLFAITCNDLYKVSEFLVNRPGRFHYHFRFDYPSAEEIREYMHDKLGNGNWENEQIEEVIKFSRKINLNYDCLRAICFELKNGDEFKDAIKDLNIVNTNLSKYDITLRYTDGTIMIAKEVNLDMFNGEDTESIWLYEMRTQDDIVEVSFNISDATFSSITNEFRIDGSKLTFRYDESSYVKEKVDRIKQLKPDHLAIRMHVSKNLHYMV